MLREAKAAQAPRAHFDPCRSEALFFFYPEVERVVEALPARCWETRLLPVSHAAVAHGDGVVSPGLEVDPLCFWGPVMKKKKKREEN